MPCPCGINLGFNVVPEPRTWCVIVRENLYPGPLCSEAQRRGELPGIEGVLGKVLHRTIWHGLQGAVRLERYMQSGKLFQSGEELGVDRAAEPAERQKFRRVVGIFDGKHAGGCC